MVQSSGEPQQPSQQPPSGSPPAAPVRKKRTGCKIVGAGLGAIVLIVIIVSIATSGGGSPTSQPAPPATTSQPATTSNTSGAPTSGAPAAPKTQPPKKPAGTQYTTSQKMAIAAANNYLSLGQGFSKKGLIDQLDSPDGDGFSKADATFAVDHITVDWNAQAVLAAKNYLATQPMSQAALVTQLESPYGSEFTHAQAEYGAKTAYAQR